MKNHTKIFWFMTFHIKLELVQKLCVLDSIKWMDFLKFMIETRYLVWLGSEKYDARTN